MGLQIDLSALRANYRALAARAPTARAAGVVKADGYGLGAGLVAQALAAEGATDFFVALASEAPAVREGVGPGPRIFVLSGHMAGADLGDAIPVLNSPEQYFRDRATRPGRPFAIQLDTGMNRLGLEAPEWEAVAPLVLEQGPELVMSHLACADEPDHPMNAAQLAEFHAMTDGIGVPRSLAATGGILLGPEFHFELTRPGVGLYGGRPHVDARPVVGLALPIIQVREVAPGEIVGYSCGYTATQPRLIATVGAGYADGLTRRYSNQATLWDGDVPCPIVGRVSMDLITVDVSHLHNLPRTLDILGPMQGVDDLADIAGTIGYEVLTSLGHRYTRRYVSAAMHGQV